MMVDDIYPTERKAKRVLELSCPDADPELRDNAAYLVSKRQRTIDEAIAYLTSTAEQQQGPGGAPAHGEDGEASPSGNDAAEPVGGAYAAWGKDPPSPQTALAPRAAVKATSARTPAKDAAAKAAVSSPARSPSKSARAAREKDDADEDDGDATRTEEVRRTPASPPKTTTSTTAKVPVPAPKPAARKTFDEIPNNHNRSLDTALAGDPAHRIIHEQQVNTKLIHYYYGDSAADYDTDVLGNGVGQCILFTTSMTGDRQVRDHCRQMETLLYLKQIPHHVMDVADNAFLKRKAREVYRSGTGESMMPNMPLLCVDNRYVGGFEQVQDLEDSGALDFRLARLGVDTAHLHRAKPDYFDATKKDENFAIMTPATTRARDMGDGDADRAARASPESAQAPATAARAPATAEEAADRRARSAAASAAAVTAADARRRVEELEAARRVRQEAAAAAAAAAGKEAAARAEAAQKKAAEEAAKAAAAAAEKEAAARAEAAQKKAAEEAAAAARDAKLKAQESRERAEQEAEKKKAEAAIIAQIEETKRKKAAAEALRRTEEESERRKAAAAAAPTSDRNGTRFVASAARRSSAAGQDRLTVTTPSGSSSSSSDEQQQQQQRLLHAAAGPGARKPALTAVEAKEDADEAATSVRSVALSREITERYRELPAWRHALIGESHFEEIHEHFLDSDDGARAGGLNNSRITRVEDRRRHSKSNSVSPSKTTSLSASKNGQRASQDEDVPMATAGEPGTGAGADTRRYGTALGVSQSVSPARKRDSTSLPRGPVRAR